jgi:hypothetical protein
MAKLDIYDSVMSTYETPLGVWNSFRYQIARNENGCFVVPMNAVIHACDLLALHTYGDFLNGCNNKKYHCIKLSNMLNYWYDI